MNLMKAGFVLRRVFSSYFWKPVLWNLCVATDWPHHSLLYPVCGFYSDAYFFVQTGILFFHIYAILYIYNKNYADRLSDDTAMMFIHVVVWHNYEYKN